MRKYLAREIAHLVEVLAQHAEPWVPSPALQTSAVVVHTSNLGTEEVEARGSEVQNQTGLCETMSQKKKKDRLFF